ncbi:MAG: SPASM domain-containing protein, partial [Deltaproteobacteria bacterium]|nr:SPASM domain-containing protein [Deltaproteobacteria bacterium]
DNIRAFTSNGGVAYWKFIVFEHNEHQIRDAEKVARDIGCSRFFVISSQDHDDECRRPKTFDFRIKRDIYLAYHHRQQDKENRAMCKPFHKGSIYIAADGTVHPCCFAHCMYITEHNKLFRYIVPLIDKYHDHINFKTTPLQEIVSGPYFKAVLSKSKNNPYCLIKCNENTNAIRKELVLYEKKL